MDYLDFFNLREDPFGLTPDSSYFYPSKMHNDVLASLDYAVEQKEGFSLVIGEPGTGKTTLVKIFVNRWQDKAEIALIMTPRLSPEELLQAVLEDLTLRQGITNKNGLIMAFRDFLIDRSLAGKRVIIIVDEAQNLSDAALEELRLLSNLETDKEKLLQIILVGQPELSRRLQAEDLRQLNQRITVRANLRPLTAEEISDYITFRLIKAGKGSPVFGEEAKKFIAKLSRGIPRMINLLTSRAMMAAYIASSHNIRKIHVRSAAEHVAVVSPKRRWWMGYAVSFLLVVALTSLSLFLYQTFQDGGSRAVETQKTAGLPSAAPAALAPKAETTGPNPVPLKPAVLPAEPKKDRRTATITSEAARLREGPSLETKIAGIISPDDSLMLLDEWTERSGNKWYKVKTPSGKEGWIASYIIRINSSR